MPSMDEIYREHSRTVYRYLLSLTHDAGLAEELTQETFYQAVRSLDRFDGSCKVTTWLCAIAKNSLLGWRRKHPTEASIDEIAPAASSATPERDVVASSERVELMRMLHLLDDMTREVMYLRLLGELSFREIGDILSITENRARVTYFRGREKLKRELCNEDRL